MDEEQLQFLKDYDGWKIDRKLNMAYLDTPEEYLQDLKNATNQSIIDKAIAFVEKYEKGSPWSSELIQALASILRNEKE